MISSITPPKIWTRITGSLALGLLGIWITGGLREVVIVSPIHWPLLAPYISLHILPIATGFFVAIWMIVAGKAPRPLLTGFVLALLQNVWIFSLAPDFRADYETTVAQSREVRQWTPPDAQKENDVGIPAPGG